MQGGQTKEGFIRDSLIQLYSAYDAPETIDAVELREVNESTYQFLSCLADFDVEYTSEIGYDRKEQYLDETKVYDSTLKQYVSKTVVKERTVTDWRPHSGKAHKTAMDLTALTNNDTVDYGDLDPELAKRYSNYKYDEVSVVANGVQVTNEEVLSHYDFAQPTDEELLSSLSSARIKATSEVAVEQPGDRHKNYRPTAEATDVSFFVLAVERFKTSFDFNGKTHFLKQFSTQKSPTIYCSAMNSDEEANMLQKMEDDEIAADPIIQTNRMYAKYTSYVFLGFIGFAILFGLILPSLFDFPGALLTILCVLGAVASFLVNKKIFSKKADDQTNVIKDRFQYEKNIHFKKLQEKKISLLNARLLMMGQEPLTEDELALFSEDNKHQLDANYKNKKVEE